MSFFLTTCEHCGKRYMHCFVGTELVSGHVCQGPPKNGGLTLGHVANDFRKEPTDGR